MPTSNGGGEVKSALFPRGASAWLACGELTAASPFGASGFATASHTGITGAFIASSAASTAGRGVVRWLRAPPAPTIHVPLTGSCKAAFKASRRGSGIRLRGTGTRLETSFCTVKHRCVAHCFSNVHYASNAHPMNPRSSEHHSALPHRARSRGFARVSLTPEQYRAARLERGNIADVARYLRVSRVTIQRRENGDIAVTHEAMLALLSMPLRPAQIVEAPPPETGELALVGDLGKRPKGARPAKKRRP